MRKEYKFLMDNIQLSNFLNYYSSELQVLHKPNNIKSVYYDTSDFFIYRSSMYRDINKFKFRIREYNNENQFHTEVKISHHQKLKFKSKKFSENDQYSKIYFKNFNLEQKSIVLYSRKYYKFFNSRLTIDRSIEYHKPKSNIKFLEPSTVLELKLFDNSFTDIQRYFPKNPVRFSKFENSIANLYFPHKKISLD